jgi:hypothetical protein
MTQCLKRVILIFGIWYLSFFFNFGSSSKTGGGMAQMPVSAHGCDVCSYILMYHHMEEIKKCVIVVSVMMAKHLDVYRIQHCSDMIQEQCAT